MTRPHRGPSEAWFAHFALELRQLYDEATPARRAVPRTDGGEVPSEYQIERRDRRNGPAIFVARELHTPGPTGVGATEEEAVRSLEKAISRWRKVESAALEEWRTRTVPKDPGGDLT